MVLGANLFKKAKEMFTTPEADEDDNLSSETKSKLVSVSSLDYVAKEMVNHIAMDEIGNFSLIRKQRWILYTHLSWFSSDNYASEVS